MSLAPSCPRAQAPPMAGQAPPQFRAAANLVRVDVYATTDSRPVLDLGQNDFEVYEDGVLQKIDSFEHVVSRLPVPESERVRTSLGRGGAGRGRRPAHRALRRLLRHAAHLGYKKGDEPPRPTYDPTSVGRALTTFLHRGIGEDDLVAIMQPETSLASLRFTRRPSRFDEFLLSGAEWQRRYIDGLVDNVERLYDACYAKPEERDIFSAWSPGAARCGCSTRCADSPSGLAHCARGARPCSWSARGGNSTGRTSASPGRSRARCRRREASAGCPTGWTRPGTRAATTSTRRASATG